MKRGHETNDEEGEGDAKGKGENVKAEGGVEERKIEDGLFIFFIADLLFRSVRSTEELVFYLCYLAYLSVLFLY